MRLLFNKSIILVVLNVVGIFLSFQLGAATASNNAITPGEVRVSAPTLHSIGIKWAMDGDSNRNASVAVAYRDIGEAMWHDALPLFRTNGEVVAPHIGPMQWQTPNQFAGSILDLQPGTPYEVRLSLTDPDGGTTQRTITASTRSQPVACTTGSILHLYPKDYQGDEQSPSFNDFEDAYREVKPCDTILVHSGLYEVPVPANGNKGGYLLDKQAGENTPITIRGSGDGESIFESSGGQGLSVIFELAGASNHIFDNLTFRRGDTQIYSESGHPATNITIENSRFEEASSAVLCRDPNCRGFVVTDNTMVGTYTTDNWYVRERIGFGVAVSLSGQGHDIGYNDISRYWDAIGLAGKKPSPDTPENDAVDIYDNRISYIDDDCIEMDTGVSNIRVQRNYCFNVFSGVSAQPLYGGPGYIVRNVIYNALHMGFKFNYSPSGLQVFNNTLVNTSGFVQSGMWSNSQIVNNLFLGVDDPANKNRALQGGTYTPDIGILDYNGYRENVISANHSLFLWRPTSRTEENYADLAQFASGTGWEQHGIVVDYDIFRHVGPPKGATDSLPALDFHLNPTSVAVDAGVVLNNITDGFAGAAPDLGAYEGDTVLNFGPRG